MPVTVLALVVAVYTFLASVPAIPHLFGETPDVIRGVGGVEDIVPIARLTALRSHSVNTKYIVFGLALLLPLFAMRRVLSAVEKWLPVSIASVCGLTLTTAFVIVLGLFAARLKMHIFHPAGLLDPICNGVAFGVGALYGIALVIWRR